MDSADVSHTTLPNLRLPNGEEPYKCTPAGDGSSFLLSSTKYLLLEPITLSFNLPRDFLEDNGIEADCDALLKNTAYCESVPLPDAKCPPVMNFFVGCEGSNICDQVFNTAPNDRPLPSQRDQLLTSRAP